MTGEISGQECYFCPETNPYERQDTTFNNPERLREIMEGIR